MSHLIQGTSEWHALRQKSIGASDAAVILGISPWKTRLELWEEKMGFSTPNQTFKMLRGIEMEDEARLYYERITGEIVFPKVMIHPEYPWCIASLDGITLNEKRLVEIKCPGRDTIEMAKNGKIPEFYVAQLQHQMMVTNLDNADYFCYDGEKGFLITIDRDQSFIDQLLKKELEFYEMMINFIHPIVEDNDRMDLSSDEEFLSLEEEFISVSETLKKLEQEKDAIRKQILVRAFHSNAKGKSIRVTKKVAKGRIEYDKIECLKDVDLEIYRKPSATSFMITY